MLALVACKSATQPTTATGDVAFVDVTVIPMDREQMLAHQTVVVKGDHIVAVGSSIKLAPGVKTIDGKGKFLIPGLADMHVHTFDPRQLALFVTEGVTTIRVMWGFPATLGARDNAASRLSPTIATAGSIIDGVPPIWPGSTGVSTAAEATAAVEAQKRAGYDFIKVYNKLSPEAYAAIVAAAAKANMRVIGHVPTAMGLEGVLAAKQASIEHLDGYAKFARRANAPPLEEGFKARLKQWQQADPARVKDAVARTKAAGTWNCPTLIVMQRLANMDRPQTLERPENRFVPPPTRESWDPKKDFRLVTWTAEDFEAARGGIAWNQKLVKELATGGVGLLAGTDVGNPWLVPGFSLHEELTLLVGAGLTPYQALRAATAAPAEFLHSDAGTIAVGKRADLVLLDANPLADIHNTSKIAGVMLRGRWLPGSELHDEQERIALIYIGKASRFTTPFDAKDAEVKARFTYAGPLGAGEERIAASPAHIVGDIADDGLGNQHVEIDLGADGHGQRMHITGDGLDLSVVREQGKAHLTGRVGGDKLDVSEPLAADEVLGGEPVIADAIFMHGLKDLAVGKERDVTLLVLVMMPKPSFQRMSLHLKRLPDSTRTIGSQKLPVRQFSVGLGMQTWTIETDELGWPVSTQAAVRVD